MNKNDNLPIIIEREMEKLRQEKETFDQQKSHESRWFSLRLIMGYTSVFLLGTIMALCSYVLINNSVFPLSVVTSAGAALFIDVVGLLVGVWKIVLNPNFLKTLHPATSTELDYKNLLLDSNGERYEKNIEDKTD